MRLALLASPSSARDEVVEILSARGHDPLPCDSPDQAIASLTADHDIGGLLVVSTDDRETGFEICWDARLCASAERPLYIGLLSPALTPEQMAEALDCGADDVLPLPLSSAELYARLRSAERLQQLQLRLVELATRDGLTKLFNRQAFFRGAERRCRQCHASCVAIMLDIDHFKSVNDRFGHAAGDAALKIVARLMQQRCSVAARLGGEEFVMLPAVASIEEALDLAESLRAEIAAEEVVVDELRFHVTCSFGVAMAEKCANIDALLRHADAALYAAKNGGRNRVMRYEPGAGLPSATGLIRDPCRGRGRGHADMCPRQPEPAAQDMNG